MSATWDCRLGWIVPSWNTVTEFEATRLAPPGISQHFTRIAHTEDTEAAFERMAVQAPEAADLLAHAGVDALCYACTAGSFFRGRAYDVSFSAELTARAGRPVVTMADTLVQAAHALGIERVAVGAPYEAWLMDLLVAYLEEGGLTVLRAAGLGHQANVLYEPSKAVELADAAWDPAADGLILSCGNFRTLESIDLIEARFQRPVITSVQAAMWGLLQATGTQRGGGPGRLLGTPAPSQRANAAPAA